MIKEWWADLDEISISLVSGRQTVAGSHVSSFVKMFLFSNTEIFNTHIIVMFLFVYLVPPQYSF